MSTPTTQPLPAEDHEKVLGRLQAELARVQNLLDRLLMEQSRTERDIWAAARRDAKDDALLWSDHHFSHLLDRAAAPFAELIYRIGELPDRPGQRAVEGLRVAASTADHVLRTHRGHLVTLPDYAGRVRVEEMRLRGYIAAAGRRLHEAAAADGAAAGRCGCAGCDLIRGMDVPEGGG